MEKTSRYGYRLLVVASVCCIVLLVLHVLARELDLAPAWTDARNRPSSMRWLGAVALPLLLHMLRFRPNPGRWRNACALGLLVMFVAALSFGLFESLPELDGGAFYVIDLLLVLAMLVGLARVLYGEFLAKGSRGWRMASIGAAAAVILLVAAQALGGTGWYVSLDELALLPVIWLLLWLAARFIGARAGRMTVSDPLEPFLSRESVAVSGAAAGWTLATLAAIFVLLAAVNLFDEDLKPQARAALERSSKTAQAGNGFFFLQGLDAPVGADPHALGVKIAEHYRAVEHQARTMEPFTTEQLYGGKKVAFGREAGAIRELCKGENPRCFTEYVGKRQAVAKLAASNAVLLERYGKLIAYPEYEDYAVRSPVTPIPAFQPLFNAVTVRHAQCALLVTDGRAASCLEMLEHDVAFARRMLAGSTELISKMVAARLLHLHFQFLGDLLATRPQLARSDAVRRLALPLAAAEKDMSRVGTEFLTLPGLLKAPGMLGADWLEFWLLRPFLKTNATLNRAYEVHRLRIEAWSLPAAKLSKERVSYLSQMKDLVDLRRQGVALLYNPVGKALLGLEEPTVGEDYVLRLNDLDGLMRLVALQSEAMRKGVAPGAMPGFLKTADPQLLEPYAERPMEWNAETKAISFTARSERYRKGGRIEVFVP